MQNASSGGLVGRAVVEALDALAAPKVRNAVLALALRWARAAKVPESGPEVRTFVTGALFAAAEQVLGASAAESILSQLTPIAKMVGSEEVSQVRPSRVPPPADDPEADDPDDFPELEIARDSETPSRRRGDAALYRTGPAPESLSVVLVASVDPSGAQQVNRALAGVSRVQVVRDVLDILDELRRTDTSLVVVDCRRPVVSVETLLALGPEMPDDSQIVLWGERADLEADLHRIGSSLPDNWVCCGPDASADDVGAVCRILLD